MPKTGLFTVVVMKKQKKCLAFSRFYRGGEQTTGRTRRRNRYIDESSHTAPCELQEWQKKKAAGFSVFLPCFGFVGIESSRTEGKRQFFRARFYRSTKIRSFAHFAPAEILLGSAFPKPCYAACAA